VDLCVRPAPTQPAREAAEEALSATQAALPKGSPFPNRPHEVTALVVTPEDGHALSDAGGKKPARCLGVRLRCHLREDGTGTRTGALLLKRGGDASDPLPLATAREALTTFFGG
jgi:hypothetical protein